MTPAADASAALPPHRSRPSRAAWLSWVAAAAVAGLLAGVGVAPFANLALLIVVAALLGVLASPYLFLWVLTAIAGLGIGWTDQAALEVAGRAINVNGLRWLLTISACVVILLRTPGERLPRELRPWLLFVLLSATGILWSTDRAEGVKATLLYGAPLLVALVTIRTVRTEAGIRGLQWAVYAGVALTVAVGLAAAALGYPLDPEGRLLNRHVAILMLPAVALLLAAVRYRGLRHAAWVLLLLVLMVPTLARGSIGVAYALILLTAAAGASVARRIAGAALVALVAIVALQYEPVRERLFANPRQGFTNRVVVVSEGGSAQLDVAGLQLTGRGMLWLRTWAHATEQPLRGHGTGSATHYLAGQPNLGGMIHPHNEYVRLFHDGGYLGVGVLLVALLGTITRLRRLGASAAPLTRELAWAALLCWVALALTAMLDNTLGYYVLLTHTVFLVTALAICAARLPTAAAPAHAVRSPPHDA